MLWILSVDQLLKDKSFSYGITSKMRQKDSLRKPPEKRVRLQQRYGLCEPSREKGNNNGEWIQDAKKDASFL